MDKFEAEKIINAYGAAIADVAGIFKKQSSLPCSKARIRHAFYIYISAIINEIGSLQKKIGENLITSYSMLDAFVSDDDVERLNKIPEKIKNKELNAENSEDKRQISEYFSLVTGALCNNNYFNEINEYIGECYEEKNRVEGSNFPL